MEFTDARPVSELLIALSRVSKSYRKGRTIVPVLDDFWPAIEPGAWVALLGPSGSGKSTLLNSLGGVDVADSGSVRVAGDGSLSR